MARRHLAALLTVLLAATTVGGCGGSSSGDHGASPDLASLSPQEILDASVAAMGTVHSYRVAGTLEDKDGHTRLSADVTDAGSVRATYTTAGSTVSYIVVGQQSYIRGDRRFWLDGKTDRVSRRLAGLFAGRWVKVPRAQANTLQKDIQRLQPKEQAFCLPLKIGTLTKVGVRTVRGRRVVVIRDKGDVPGGTPGELSVATHGRALPMRERQTGRTRPGGHFEPRCDDKDDTSTRSDATISHYDKIPPIQPPPHPFDPGQVVPPSAGGGVSA